MKDKIQNTEKDMLTEALARNTLDNIPTPNSDAKEIVGLVKSSGRVTGYQLSDGSTVSKQEGVELARQGDINFRFLDELPELYTFYLEGEDSESEAARQRCAGFGEEDYPKLWPGIP